MPAENTQIIGANLSQVIVNNDTGTIYHSPSNITGFNTPFIDNNVVVTFNAGKGAYPAALYSHSITEYQFQWYVWSTKAGDIMTDGTSWQAMGRWK